MTEPNWALVGVIAEHARKVRDAEHAWASARKARADFVTANQTVIDQLRKLELAERVACDRARSTRDLAFDEIGWVVPKEES